MSLPAVAGFIGLCGPFDLERHYAYERARGVHQISPLKPCNGSQPQALRAHSPTHLITQLTPAQVQRLPRFCLIHGLLDDVVPLESSIRFNEALTKAGANVTFVTLPNGQAYAWVF